MCFLQSFPPKNVAVSKIFSTNKWFQTVMRLSSQKCVCICMCVFWWRETQGERETWKESVCVCLRERQKRPLIHSVSQFPWWFELYLTMWRIFSASIFAVSLLHLFQCSELKVWMASTERTGAKTTCGLVSGPGQFTEDVLMSADRLDSDGYKHLSEGWGGQSSFLQGCVEGCGKLMMPTRNSLLHVSSVISPVPPITSLLRSYSLSEHKEYI